MKIQPTKLDDISIAGALDDLSTHVTMICVNHPGNVYSSKNPFIRNTFILEGTGCPCGTSELRVIDDGQEPPMEKENSGRDIIAPESAVIVRTVGAITGKTHRAVGKVINARSRGGFVHYFVVTENGARTWYMEGMVSPVR